MPELIPRQVHDLAPVAQAMIWFAPGPGNITAVNLSKLFLSDLARNVTTFHGATILSIMRNATFNATLTDGDMNKTLTAMTLMPASYQHGLAAIWGVMILLSTPMMFLRLYSRIRYSGGLKRDDYFLIVAWLVATANNIEDMHLAVVDDFGAHGWNVTRDQMLAHIHIGAVDGYLFAIATWFFKISLIIFFHDLYPARGFRILCYCVGSFLTLFSSGLIVYLYERCHPFDKWNHPFETHCIPSALLLAKIFTIINIAIDVLILCLPVYIVFHMHVSLRERVQVILLMGLGSIVCLASIMRYFTLNYWINNSDSTWRSIPITHWTLLESQLGIICARVPAVRKWILHVAPRVKKYISPRSPSGSKGSSTLGSVFSAMSSSKHSDSKGRMSEEKPRFLRPSGLRQKQPPVGDLTAIMNMKTDLESGMGTVVGDGSRIAPADIVAMEMQGFSSEEKLKSDDSKDIVVPTRVLHRSVSGEASVASVPK